LELRRGLRGWKREEKGGWTGSMHHAFACGEMSPINLCNYYMLIKNKYNKKKR
jgi:hypothetical protein